jgi:hypothetical protein
MLLAGETERLPALPDKMNKQTDKPGFGEESK